MRALLSVYDKAGIVELARGLVDAGWELVSSGGTAAALGDAGLQVTDTAELTGYPAILGHRVVTLHPKVHGAILADRSDPAHRADLDEHGIDPIDLVVVNLYPFSAEPSVELIDIGGPAMVRAAAKNHAHVGVVVDPADYERVLAEIRRDGALSEATRRELARAAFARSAAYDNEIVAWLDTTAGAPEGAGFPPTLHLDYERVQLQLRYGENPHQQAALYRATGTDPWWDRMRQHAGLPLSYLNLNDADAAWLLAHDLAGLTGKPACAIIKHANPCGAAVADRLADAYQSAFEGDELSAFGGIVALTDPIDDATVEHMVAAAQADVVIAPGYGDGVVDRLVAKRKNTRLIEAPSPEPDPVHLRPITGGLLVQDPYRFAVPRHDWRVVTKRSPSDAEWVDAELAWHICGFVKSNCVALVNQGKAVGIGAGQQSRVGAAEIAAEKAAGRAAGGASATDGFYPFPDGVEAAAAAGVAVVVQPGGSVRDDQIVARADELGLAMVLTGERQFQH